MPSITQRANTDGEKPKCCLCDAELQQGENGVCITFGWWKRIGDDESDFDPNGNEYDTCGKCADLISERLAPLLSNGKGYSQ